MAPYSHYKLPRKLRSPIPPKSTFKRSPSQYRAPRKSVASGSRVNFKRDKPPLEPISELWSPNLDRERRRPRSLYASGDPFASDDEEDENEFDQELPTFTWEDENTLVSDLLQDSSKHESEDDKLASLADSIQTSFSLHSEELVGEIADALVPAVNRVKRAHQILNNQVDKSFGMGVLQFDDACKRLEAVTIKDHNELLDAYTASQKRVEGLVKQLKEEYDRRDQLWVDFEKVLDDTIQPTKDILRKTPERMEHVIANIEKECKQLGKADGGSSKHLKGILSKFG